ncbi:MAG: hypothetical protein IKU57_02275 [Oscillospiraceae bacterium]|nr:hypothetical protein [Oscillospiraceae bacterium]
MLFKEKKEAQLNRRITALEEQQLWQQEQGELLQNNQLEVHGIRTYHENMLTSVNSTQIRRELEEGPPQGMTKAEKKLWKEKMGILQKLAQERDQFLAPVNGIRFLAENKLKQCRQEGRERVADYARVMRETGQESLLEFQNQPVKDPAILEKHPEIGALQKIAEKLKQYTPESITKERLQELAGEYKSLKRSAGATSEKQLAQAVNFSGCEAGYALLFQCVVSVLTNCLDKLPMDKVNMDYFTKLCGLEKGLGLMAAQMKLSVDYKKQSQAYQEAEARKQLEQEQKLREAKENLEARRVYLRTGIVGRKTPAQWVLGPYAKIIEQELGAWFKQPECRIEEVAARVQEMERSFLENREQMQRRVAEHPALIFKVHREQVLSWLEQEINKDRLYPMGEAEIQAAVERAVEPLAEELERCQQRREYLASQEELKDILSLSPLPNAIEKLLLDQNTRSDFEAQVSLLTQQMEYNLDVCQGILDAQLKCTSSRPILEWLKRHHGTTLLEGTLAQVQAVAQHCQNEEELKKTFERDRQLSMNVEKNQEVFEKLTWKQKLSAPAWSQLLQWQEENIMQEEKQFGKELKSLIKELSKSKQGTLSLLEYLEGGELAEEVLETPEVQQEQKQQTKQQTKNVEQVKGKELCRWEGFSGFLQGYEDDVMAALEKLLREGQLKLDFLDSVAEIADLENLTFVEFQTLVRHLRVNLGKSIRSWHALEGANAREVRIQLLAKMLIGELTDENFMDEATKVEKDLRDEAYVTALRFRCMLKGKGVRPQYPRRLEYRYMDDTDSRASGKETRAERRTKRFNQTGAIWDVLKENGLMQEAIEKLYAAKDDAVSMRVGLLTILEKVRGKNRRANALYEKLDNMSNKEFKDISYELRLCGQESVFLSKEYNPEGYNAFTGSERKEYAEVLKKIGDKALSRMWQLENHLKNYADPFEANELREQFAILAVGLQELEEEQNTRQKTRSPEQERKAEENFRQFGISSWMHARKELIDHLKFKKDRTMGDTYEILQFRETMLQEQMERRREQMLAYGNGMLWPVEELLYKDKDFWSGLVEDNQEQFAKRLDAVGKRLQEPLTLLRNLYPYGAEFKKQVIDELGGEMISGEKTADEWKRLYRDCYDRFCSHCLKGTSIDKAYRKVIDEDHELGNFLTALVLEHREGLSLLADETELRAQLKVCKERAKANTETLDTFMREKELRTIEQVGFRMFLQDKIPFVQAEKFHQGLERWMEEFRKESAKTEKNTARAQEVMNERAEIMLDVESHRESGRMADQKTQTMLRYAPTKMRGTGSPVLASLGVHKKPELNRIEKAKKEVQKYEELSQRAQNCLFEFILSGKTGVKGEAEWLKKIDGMVDALCEEKKESEQGKADLLTYIYTRYRGKDLTPEQVGFAREELGKRHVLLSQLEDQTLGREEERRTVRDALAAGIYLLDEEKFRALAEGQVEYFNTARLADSMFAEEIDRSGLYSKSEEQRKMQTALAEYFHEDILKGRDHFEKHREELTQKTRKMLLEPFYLVQLLSGGKMESVGSDTLTGQEKKLHTMANRETLEQFLAEKQNAEFRSRYNALNRQQRQVFALCVLQSDPINELPSAQFVRSAELQQSRQTILQNQLENYVSHQEFQPEIAYDRVMDVLCREDGSMDKEIFEAAMERTYRCIRQYQKTTDKDLGRLGDSVRSIREASRLAGEKDAAYGRQNAQPVFSLAEMKDWILNQDGKQGTKQKERLVQMDDYRMQLLGSVLQDRTVLDRTTRKLDKGEEAEFVNQEKRTELEAQIRRDGQGMRLYTANLTRAMNTLLGYQLRDDVELGSRRLWKSDFAPGALERKTLVDWELLQRAMDFVEETQKPINQ